MRGKRGAGRASGTSPFIGRDAQLPRLAVTVAANPVVVLVGPGGVGKTRLAAETSAVLAPDLGGDTRLVDLSGAAGQADTTALLCRAFEVDDDPVVSLAQRVALARGDRSSLLVLDNCEHVAAGVSAFVSELVGLWEAIRVLATSRGPLSVPGQVVWSVQPLDLPPAPGSVASDPGNLASSPAVHLFLDRVTAAGATLETDPDTLARVARICRATDGLPLALELVAAWAAELPLEDVEARLRASSERTQPRSPSEDTRALTTVFDSSRAVLGDEARVVFDRLCAFPASFTAEGARAVCVDDDLSPAAVERALGDLVAASLLVVDGSAAGMTRYRRLTVVRLWAEAQVGADEGVERARQRHTDYILLAVDGGDIVGLPSGGDQQTRLDVDADVAAALHWSGAHDILRALRLFVALDDYWHSGVHLTQGAQAARALLDDRGSWPEDLDDGLLTATRDLGGRLALQTGDYGHAAQWFEEALGLAQHGADTAATARALRGRGIVARCRGDLEGAHELLARAVAVLGEGDPQGELATCLAEQGRVAAMLGDERAAAALLERARGLLEDGSHRQGELADVLLALGRLALLGGDAQGARTEFEAARQVAQDSGLQRGEARALSGLASVADHEDDFRVAGALSQQAMAIQRRVGDERGVANSLASLAGLAYQTGAHGKAGDLWVQALELRQRLGEREGEAAALLGLANAIFLDDPDHDGLRRAMQLCEEAVALYREVSRTAGLAWALYCLSEIARDVGDYECAERAGLESLELYRRIGDGSGSALALHSLGALAHARGQIGRAGVIATEAAERVLAMGKGLQRIRAVELEARVACARGELARAAMLYAAALTQRVRHLGSDRARTAEQAVIDRDTATIGAGLSPAEYATASDAGRALTLEEALELATDHGALTRGQLADASGPPNQPRWRVHLLNGLSVDTADGAVSLTGAVMAHVLSIVALRGSEHVEVVAELVWPDSEPGIAKRRFKHVLSRLRSACGDLLVRTGDLVALNPEAQVDVTAFERAAEDALGAVARREPDAAARCRHAVVLYRGELLPEDRYEEWTLDRRDALTQRLVRLFHALAELALVEGRPAEAVDWLERAMEADPYDESAVARAVAIMLEHDWTTRARGLARRAQRSADDLGIALPGELASLVEVPGPQPAAR